MKKYANSNQRLTLEQKEDKIKKLEDIFSNMLDVMGFDREKDQNLKNTPYRIAKMYVNELLSGVYDDEPKITIFDNSKETDSMVVLGPIRLNSMCSHHFVPFLGEAFVGYIPNKKIVGLSKLARIVHWFAKRPQIQEELGEQIADFIQEKLEPKGVGVYLNAQHGCMQIRGVEEPNASMITMALRGNFLNEITTRTEFLTYIKH